MKLTRDFIHQHKTAYGGWTRAQTNAIGVKWPLRPGWIDRAVGKEISEAQARDFIEGREKVSKYTIKSRAKKARKALKTNRTEPLEPTLHPELDPSLPPPWE